MRRIYESNALRREGGPFTPNEQRTDDDSPERNEETGGGINRYVLPEWLRRRAITLEVSTPEDEYPVGSLVPFAVTMRNPLPIAITLTTTSPLLWSWAVDGKTEASHVTLRNPPDERRGFRFESGERKRYQKHWDGTFRVGETEWMPADPGTYTISAEINVENPESAELTDETTVRIVPD